MDLRLCLAETRWGDQLTKQDLEFIKELTFFEVFASSYLLPKTAQLRTTRTLLRR